LKLKKVNAELLNWLDDWDFKLKNLSPKFAQKYLGLKNVFVPIEASIPLNGHGSKE